MMNNSEKYNRGDFTQEEINKRNSVKDTFTVLIRMYTRDNMQINLASSGSVSNLAKYMTDILFETDVINTKITNENVIYRYYTNIIQTYADLHPQTNLDSEAAVISLAEHIMIQLDIDRHDEN